MPVEVAAPVALLSLAPAGGKMALPAMPALFKAGMASGAAGKAVGATSFAGMKGGIGTGAGKGLAAKGSFATAATKKGTSDHVEHEVVKEKGEDFMMFLIPGAKAAEIMSKERRGAGKGRRVALSRRGDRSKKYVEFL